MFKYYLNNVEFKPSNEGDFTFDINKVTDAGAYHYTLELGGSIIFKDSGYDFILKHSDCQKIELRIEEVCKEGTFTTLDLFFTNRDCVFKPDLFEVEVTPKANSLYQCLTDNYDRKFNFLEVPFFKFVVFEPTAEFEYRVEPIVDPSYPPPIPGWGTPVQVTNPQAGGGPFIVWWLYVREIKVVYCNGGEPQPPSSDPLWELIEDNCAGGNYSRWARKPPIFQGSPSGLDISSFNDTTCVAPCTPATPAITGANEDWYPMITFTFGTNTFTFWVDYNVIKQPDTKFNNGRDLVDVINWGLNKHCPELDLQSRFLNDSINPVTNNSPSSTEGIQMHAISDIKDPAATEQATIEELTLRELLEGYISSKLNCFWYIDENTRRLIIEHYNDLNNTSTFDLTAIEGGKYTRNRNTYEFDNTDIPKAEEFPSLDITIDFTGVNINFDNPCASGNKAYTTDKFFSEVDFIFNNPDEFPNDGVVMITPFSLVNLNSTNTFDSARSEVGAITGVYAPNAPQAMANLHNKFWKYYRPFPSGELNFILQAFNKNRPVKKLETITIPLCCLKLFNPRAAFIGNNFSNGQLQSATFNPSSQTIELTIQYE